MTPVEIEFGESVDRDLVSRVIEHANLPQGPLLVLAGTPDLEDCGGVCIPRFLLSLTKCMPFVRRRQAPWQVGVAVSPRMCRVGLLHPAFFVQILAHELSHARLVLTDPELHVYCAFLDQAIREATSNQITESHELPHEQAHDAYGVWMAHQLLGMDSLRSSVSALLKDTTRQDHDRLQFLQSVQPRDSIAHLRDQVRSFARPFAAVLCRIWDRERSDVEVYGCPSITEHAPHISALLR